jgi:hypothetical protein
VRAGLTTLKGIDRVRYDPGQDQFLIEYDPGQIGMEAIFAEVRKSGKDMGREYHPEVIT